MGPYQIIKFEQNLCNAKLDDNEILFVRVNDVVNSPKAKIEVPITHNAIVIKGGGDMRYYKSGTYDVFDNRKEVKNWKKGMSVEVVYIPKDTRVPIKWGTPNRLLYRDDASNGVCRFIYTYNYPTKTYVRQICIKQKSYCRKYGCYIEPQF